MDEIQSYKLRLGALEMAVLDHLWNTGEGNVRTVHEVVGKVRQVSSNTIQSTLERLHRKSLLTRQKSGHAYLYRPALSRSDLMARYIHNVIDTFTDGNDHHVLTAFVDWLHRADANTLDELEELIESRRAREKGNLE